MSKKLTVRPTSRVTADCDPITLRETKTTRLIFKPLLVDNINSTEAVLRGWFIFQKKSRSRAWSEYKTLSLSHLRDKEWVKLELHSAELLHFFEELNSLYSLYQKIGIPRQETHLLEIGTQFSGLLDIPEQDLTEFLNVEGSKAGLDILSRLLNWAGQLENTGQVVEKLEQLRGDSLKQLNSLVGLSTLKNSLRIWEGNETNSDEEFWQITLADNAFVISQIFAYPVVIIEGKAYVGGKELTNKGGNIVDFLAKNNVTKNAILIEIKTPTTPLLGKKYRQNYSISSDLTGAIVQVTNYKQSLMSEFNDLNRENHFDLDVFNPQCVVIAGNLKNEADISVKRKSFELFRTGLRDIQIISYDELFQKIRILVELLEGEPEEEIEIPF